MMGVLLQGHGWAQAQGDRWRVFILEDTGEMIRADAKERVAQGLSRLLNLVDGLIGQGLRILMLITTNERLGELHSAVARPGRCAADVAFTPLDSEDARRWLVDHGADPDLAPSEPAVLAALYALVNGHATEDPLAPADLDLSSEPQALYL